jgi:hypothetical protein
MVPSNGRIPDALSANEDVARVARRPTLPLHGTALVLVRAISICCLNFQRLFSFCFFFDNSILRGHAVPVIKTVGMSVVRAMLDKIGMPVNEYMRLIQREGSVDLLAQEFKAKG